MTFGAMFEGIFCINLDRRPDRWTKAFAEFRRLGLTVERIPARDGYTSEPHAQIGPGEAGCLASHLHVLRLMLDRALASALILEDDVTFHVQAVRVLTEAFERRLVPGNWDLLYLGGAHLEPPAALNSVIAKVTRTLTASHYAIRPHLARRVLLSAEERPRPIDVVLADLQPDCRAYTFEPAIAWQRPGYSDIRGKRVDYRRFMAPASHPGKSGNR